MRNSIPDLYISVVRKSIPKIMRRQCKRGRQHRLGSCNACWHKSQLDTYAVLQLKNRKRVLSASTHLLREILIEAQE